MPALFSPEFVIDITDTIAATKSATVTFPRATDSYTLVSLTTTGSAAGTTVTVGTAIVGAIVAAVTTTLNSTDATVAFTGSITVACGGAGNITRTVLRLRSAIGPSATVTLQAT